MLWIRPAMYWKKRLSSYSVRSGKSNTSSVVFLQDELFCKAKKGHVSNTAKRNFCHTRYYLVDRYCFYLQCKVARSKTNAHNKYFFASCISRAEKGSWNLWDCQLMWLFSVPGLVFAWLQPESTIHGSVLTRMVWWMKVNTGHNESHITSVTRNSRARRQRQCTQHTTGNLI